MAIFNVRMRLGNSSGNILKVESETDPTNIKSSDMVQAQILEAPERYAYLIGQYVSLCVEYVMRGKIAVTLSKKDRKYP